MSPVERRSWTNWIERWVGVELPDLGRQGGEDRHVAEIDLEPDQVGRVGVLGREIDIAGAVVGGAARRRPFGRVVDRREAQQSTVDAVHLRAEGADRRGGRHRVGDQDLVVIVVVAAIDAGHDDVELTVEQIPIGDAGHPNRERQRDDAGAVGGVPPVGDPGRAVERRKTRRCATARRSCRPALAPTE